MSTRVTVLLNVALLQSNISIFPAMLNKVYTRVLLALFAVYGSFVVGLFISWTTISIELYTGMDRALLAFVVSFQGEW